jgi:hypothetical protein
MTNMCTCVILLLLKLAVNMFMNNILTIAKMRLNLTKLRIEMYPAEGPMIKAPVAPVLLMVSCSKSRTIIGEGRYTQCSPSNVHRKVDNRGRRRRRRQSQGKKRVVTKTLPKNLIARTPVQVSQMQTAVLDTYSPNSPCAQRIGTRKLRGQGSSEKWKTLIDYLRIFQTKNFQ